MSEPTQAAEPTRAKVYGAVKKSAVASGLSLAALAGLAIPWATGVSSDVGATKAAIANLRSDFAAVQTDALRYRGGIERVERLEPRLQTLEAARAADAATLNSIQRQLDRIDAKLDRISERK